MNHLLQVLKQLHKLFARLTGLHASLVLDQFEQKGIGLFLVLELLLHLELQGSQIFVGTSLGNLRLLLLLFLQKMIFVFDHFVLLLEDLQLNLQVFDLFLQLGNLGQMELFFLGHLFDLHVSSLNQLLQFLHLVVHFALLLSFPLLPLSNSLHFYHLTDLIDRLMEDFGVGKSVH